MIILIRRQVAKSAKIEGEASARRGCEWANVNWADASPFLIRRTLRPQKTFEL